MPRVIHFEVHADDLDRASQFYSDLFGWQFQTWDGPFEYRMIVTGPDDSPVINGGMVRRQQPLSGSDAVIGFVCTLDVDDVDSIVARAIESGGALALPKMPIPGLGWLAYVKDTEGNVLGLMQADPAAA
jgi:predicted enzyme related to lactoylglutathione lyase